VSPGVQLFLTLSAMNVGVAVVAAQLVARLAGGPRRLAAHIVPVLAAFAGSSLLGHQLGVHIGPKITLYGFEVSLFGDVAVAFAFALGAAIVQSAAWRVLGRRSRPA